MPGPLDEIALFPVRQHEERLRQREATDAELHKQRLAEIKRILKKLGGCCRPRDFRWPIKADLERLDFAVLELLRQVRKRPPLPLWKSYKAVDDHWHLGLLQTLRELVDRAARHAPPRPLEEYDERLGKAALSDQSAKLFQYFSEVARGRDPSSVRWEQFDELFKKVRRRAVSATVPLTSRLGECGGKPKLIAYTVFLELFCLDLQWVRKHWKGAQVLTRWVITSLQHPQMVRILHRFLIPTEIGILFVQDAEQLPELLAKKKKEAKRARDSERKGRK